MQLSLGSSDWRQVMWTEIYDRARHKNRIKEALLGPHRFEYALINPKDGYGRTKSTDTYRYTGSTVTYWIKDAEKEESWGLNYEGLAFVLERSVPPAFRDYVGLHEYVEAKTGNHAMACKIQLVEMIKDPELFRMFAEHSVASNRRNIAVFESGEKSGFFNRAIPEFLAVLKDMRLSPLEVLQRFKDLLDGIPELDFHADTTIKKSFQ